MLIFVLFKQKTAYEMRISDWSSDVCSSDLGGENLAIWIISQRMMPPVAIVFPVFLLYVWLGGVDTYWGLILLYTAFNLPYVIWMMRGYIADIPIELEESALVDGCSRWQVLMGVVFPMARSGQLVRAWCGEGGGRYG